MPIIQELCPFPAIWQSVDTYHLVLLLRTRCYQGTGALGTVRQTSPSLKQHVLLYVRHWRCYVAGLHGCPICLPLFPLLPASAQHQRNQTRTFSSELCILSPLRYCRLGLCK